jgi:hypothetical protein
MLLRNNTAIPNICVIKDACIPGIAPRLIIWAMSDADDLARRYLALWADYLTALVSDPKAAELLQRWVAFTSQFAPGQGAHDGAAPLTVAWPPKPPGRPAADGSKADAASAAGASGKRDAILGEFARRLDGIEQRLAALEPPRAPARPRRRSPQGRS